MVYKRKEARLFSSIYQLLCYVILALIKVLDSVSFVVDI